MKKESKTWESWACYKSNWDLFATSECILYIYVKLDRWKYRQIQDLGPLFLKSSPTHTPLGLSKIYIIAHKVSMPHPQTPFPSQTKGPVVSVPEILFSCWSWASRIHSEADLQGEGKFSGLLSSPPERRNQDQFQKRWSGGLASSSFNKGKTSTIQKLVRLRPWSNSTLGEGEKRTRPHALYPC